MTLTSRATHAHPTSPRSTGFCAIWDCISSSSMKLLVNNAHSEAQAALPSVVAPAALPSAVAPAAPGRAAAGRAPPPAAAPSAAPPSVVAQVALPSVVAPAAPGRAAAEGGVGVFRHLDWTTQAVGQQHTSLELDYSGSRTATHQPLPSYVIDHPIPPPLCSKLTVG